MALYSLLLFAIFLLGAPYWLVRMATTGRYRTGLAERLGRVPERLVTAVAGKQVVWIHAVSVGEVLAATRLVEDLQATLGDVWTLVVSSTTAAGQTLARQRLGSARVFIYPLDFAFATRAYLRALNPRVLVLMESELWPRMLHECRRASIPVACVNARVSDRSLRRTLPLRALWQHLILHPNPQSTHRSAATPIFLAQSEEDARRLIALGVTAASVKVSGNLKYDAREPKPSPLVDLIRTAARGRQIVIAGSTCDHNAVSEEQIFVESCMGPIWQARPETLLILAPRHPQRFDEVVRLAKTFGPTMRGSELPQLASPICLTERILILDTIGDLASLYSIATVAFVGGSLVPRGGHNPLEPARFGVPVIMGPSFENFRDVVGTMQAADAIEIVPDAFSCQKALMHLLGTTDRTIGERAREVFLQQQGATARTITALQQLLQQASR